MRHQASPLAGCSSRTTHRPADEHREHESRELTCGQNPVLDLVGAYHSTRTMAPNNATVMNAERRPVPGPTQHRGHERLQTDSIASSL